MSVRLAISTAALFLFVTPAMACSPAPPLPDPAQQAGEADEDYQLRIQQFRLRAREEQMVRYRLAASEMEDGLWAESDRVLIARLIFKAEAIIKTDFGGWAKEPVVTLKPRTWHKGRGHKTEFILYPTDYDSCSYPGKGDAIDGETGDFFLVFIKSGSTDINNITTTISASRAVTLRSKQAFESL